jgi:hypothetical protein
MCVRFNANDGLVCSVGGRDWAVFQFRVVEIRADEPPPPRKEPVWGALDNTGKPKLLHVCMEAAAAYMAEACMAAAWRINMLGGGGVIDASDMEQLAGSACDVGKSGYGIENVQNERGLSSPTH